MERHEKNAVIGSAVAFAGVGLYLFDLQTQHDKRIIIITTAPSKSHLSGNELWHR